MCNEKASSSKHHSSTGGSKKCSRNVRDAASSASKQEIADGLQDIQPVRPQRARALMHAAPREGNNNPAEHMSSTTHQASNHLEGTTQSCKQLHRRVQQQCWCERIGLHLASQIQGRGCDPVCSLAGKLLVWSSDCTAPRAQRPLRLGLFVTFCMTACALSRIGQLTGGA